MWCVCVSVLADNIEAVLESHQHRQDKLAEEMIEMAKSLKNNSLIARDIIRGDTKVVTFTLIIIMIMIILQFSDID